MNPFTYTTAQYDIAKWNARVFFVKMHFAAGFLKAKHMTGYRRQKASSGDFPTIPVDGPV